MHLASKCFDLAIVLCAGRQEKSTPKSDMFGKENNVSSGAFSYGYNEIDNNLEINQMNTEMKSLLNRRGNLSNERGVFYVNQADLLAKSEKLTFRGHIPEAIIKILDASTVHLKNGLKDFKVNITVSRP